MPIEDCYEVVLPEIRIGDWVGYNWPFVTSLSVPFRLLLGTDSMQLFDWHFDYGKWRFSFELIPGRRKLLFNLQEQSIHAIAPSELALPCSLADALAASQAEAAVNGVSEIGMDEIDAEVVI